MKALAVIFVIVGLIWVGELIAFIFTDWKPEPFTIGVAIAITAYTNFKWAKEYYEESK